ncbi:hypothetical protein Aperf_G00000094419 [Anoplocephala perfoliata]
MSDREIFERECLSISNCAKQYFGGEDLPRSLELCIDTAINWIVGSGYPPLSILGQRVLRAGLSLPSYHETVSLLRSIIDMESPSVFLFGFINLLQKVVEVVCYDSWTFALKPKRLGIADDNLYQEVVSLTADLKLDSESTLNPDVYCFNFKKCAPFLTYTKTRVLYALGTFQPSMTDDIFSSAEAIIGMCAEDDVLLFRMLITLLMMENEQLKSGGKCESKIPTAHDLFVSLMEWIDYDHHTLIDWLVSPETDCLTYLLAYTKRLGVTANREIGPEKRDLWCPTSKWLEEHVGNVKQLLTDTMHSLLTLHNSGSLPFSPELLIANISKALEVLK